METKDNKELSWIKKAWNDKRGRAAIKLAIWLIILTVLLIILQIGANINSNSTSNRGNEEKLITLKDKQTVLENAKEYEFVYNITINNMKYNYKGTYNNGIVNGYKKTNEGIIEYVIENNVVYDISTVEKVAIDNLYLNINEKLLNFNYLFALLSIRTYTERDNKYIYDKFTLPDANVYEVSIEITEDKISKIIVLENEDLYELEFMDIK